MTDLVRIADSIAEANRQRIERFKYDLATEGLLTVEGEVLDPEPVGEEYTPYPEEVPDTSSPTLPGLELAKFEHQIKSALDDLVTTVREDPEEFRSFPFQNTVQNKMNRAVEKLEEALF